MRRRDFHRSLGAGLGVAAYRARTAGRKGATVKGKRGAECTEPPFEQIVTLFITSR
jgi:hypothetical protein